MLWSKVGVSRRPNDWGGVQRITEEAKSNGAVMNNHGRLGAKRKCNCSRLLPSSKSCVCLVKQRTQYWKHDDYHELQLDQQRGKSLRSPKHIWTLSSNTSNLILLCLCNIWKYRSQKSWYWSFQRICKLDMTQLPKEEVGYRIDQLHWKRLWAISHWTRMVKYQQMLRILDSVLSISIRSSEKRHCLALVDCCDNSVTLGRCLIFHWACKIGS